MTQTANNYATVLLELGVTREAVDETKEILSLTQDLPKSLKSPVVSKQDKHKLIDRIFPASLRTFLKVVCQNGQIDSILDIFSEYQALERQQRHCAHAVLEYVTPLTEAQLAAMKKMICAKTGEPEVQLELKQNPALLGGFVLHIWDDEYDRSMRASIRNMRKSLIRR